MNHTNITRINHSGYITAYFQHRFVIRIKSGRAIPPQAEDGDVRSGAQWVGETSRARLYVDITSCWESSLYWGLSLCDRGFWQLRFSKDSLRRLYTVNIGKCCDYFLKYSVLRLSVLLTKFRFYPTRWFSWTWLLNIYPIYSMVTNNVNPRSH